MTITKEQLRSVGIHNPYNFAGNHVFIDYCPKETGRASKAAAWKVVWPGHKTDPDAHWRDNYNKTFDVYGRDNKEPKRLEAIEWASKTYGISNWGKTPFGSYMAADILSKRMAMIKAKLQEAKVKDQGSGMKA